MKEARSEDHLTQGASSKTDVYLGDAGEVLKKVKNVSIDLIFTSPPYADNRERTYGGIKPDQYVEWFLPISAELWRVLKPTGTFVLNIKEKVVDAERHTCVIELILAMRKQGWLWTKEFHIYQEAVMVPMGEWAKTRLRNLSETDRRRDNSRVGSGFGKNVSNWLGRDKVYPTNILHFATECGNRNHSAVFPQALPEWFIKLFTREGDSLLDPFMGSGTAVIVAHEMGRNVIGIEILPEYYRIVSERLQSKVSGQRPLLYSDDRTNRHTSPYETS